MRPKLLLAAFLVAIGFGLLTGGRASANCNEMPDDPMCMPGGGGGSDMTSPPPTSPPRTSPPQTSPPIQRSYTPPPTHAPVSNPPRRTASAPRTYQPPAADPAPIDEPFIEPPVVVAPAPAIALSGTAPSLGGGVASASPKPPATESSSGAGTVLWGFGVGAGVVGIAVGTHEVWKTQGRPPDVGLDVFYSKLNPP